MGVPHETPPPKRIDIAEFRKLGFLQEVNRLFFHPRGLALEIVSEDSDCFSCGGHGEFRGVKCDTCDGEGTLHSEKLGGVWDYRDDPEGILYALPLKIDTDKVRHVEREFQKHEGVRKSLLKNDFPIQLPGQELEPAEKFLEQGGEE